MKRVELESMGVYYRPPHGKWVEDRTGSRLPSLIKPCMQSSRTRLSDVLHAQVCAEFQPALVGTLYSPWRR